MAKTEPKVIVFSIEEQEMKKCEQLLQNIGFTCCLVKTLQIPVFLAGLLWELEVAKIK